MVNFDEKLSILLVDDSDDLNELLKNTANGFKIFDVFVAKCLQDAEVLLEESSTFAIVVVDLNLCGSIDDGIILATKAKESNCNTIVAISTGYYDYLFDARLINLPIDDFIRKPFSLDLFSEKLLIWATLYKHREMSKTYIDKRMKKYEECLESLQNIEDQLKTILIEDKEGIL